MSSRHTSSGQEFPFHLSTAEWRSGNLNVFSPLASLVTGGIQRLGWTHPSKTGGAPLSYAIDLPMDSPVPNNTAFLQALNRCFPKPVASAESGASIGMFTSQDQCLLRPTALHDGQPCADQQHLLPGVQWQQDTRGVWLFGETVDHHDRGEVVLRLVRWIQLDAQTLLNEHRELLALHDVQKISLWRAAHNLLTPFNAVFGMLEMVLLGLRPEKAAQHEWAGRLAQARSYLEETIQDILKTPTVTQNTDRHAQACIQSALNSSSQMTQHMAEGRAISLHAHNIVGRAKIHPSVLTEVFLNVLGNAIKYSPAGHDIQISTHECGEFVDICFVNDLMPGSHFQIPDLANTQRHIAPQAQTGHGVGLATSVFLVRRHGGSIQQEHPQGQQCKTTIRLLAA